MTCFAPSSTRLRFARIAAMWLLIVAILTVALVPLGPSLATRPGAAFSASTPDVSLGPPNSRDVGKQRISVAPKDDGAGAGGAAGAAGAMVRMVALDQRRAPPPPVARHTADDSRRPATASLPFSARAPPAA